MATKRKTAPKTSRRPDPRRMQVTQATTGPIERCIDRRLERLSDCTRDLLATTEELTKRLERVMLSPEPMDTSGDAPTPIMTEVSVAIDRQADQVLTATRQLQSILQRLGL